MDHMINKEIADIIQASINVKQKILNDEKLIVVIKDVVSAFYKSLKSGNTVYFCGNGGSAADAQHLAAELSGRFYFDREPLASEALHCNTSYLTAVGNDYGFQHVYSRLLKGMGKKGDVLVGLSTSGNSENIVSAFKLAREMGITTVAMTGETGGMLKQLADYLINIPSLDIPRIQESHITVGHIICQLVEAKIFRP